MKIPEGYSIQLAENSHVPLLAAVEIAAATRFPPGAIPDHIRSDFVPVDVLYEAVGNGTLWVALHTKSDDSAEIPVQPVGYALLRFIEGYALLAQMDVLPEHGRKGLGTGLIGHITAYLRARNVNALYLTTFIHVPWNASFYGKCGFAALHRKEQPPFIKSILEEEKQYGLSHRIAMRLALS